MSTQLVPFISEAATARARTQVRQARNPAGDPWFGDASTPGTPGHDLAKFSAVLEQRLATEHSGTLAGSFPLTSTGSKLDETANTLRKPRRGETLATGRIRITSPTTGAALERLYGTRTLQAGLRVTADGVRETFRIVSEVSVPLGGSTVEVLIQSETARPGVVLPAGRACKVDLAGPLRSVLTVQSSTDITGGSYRESDTELQLRLMSALVSPSSFTGFTAALEAHPDVAAFQAAENVYGAGTVEAFVTPATAYPSPTLRGRLEALWRGPGGAYVVFPDYEGVVLKIRVEGGNRAQMAAAIVDYVNNLKAGDRVTLEQIETACVQYGATDAQTVGVKRAQLDQDGEAVDTFTPDRVTNLAARDTRSKWYTRVDWITFC